MGTRTLVLDAQQMEQKICRMAWEIFEKNHLEKEIVIAGISPQGALLSQRLAKHLSKIPKILVTVDFAGQAVDQKEIWELSKRYNFKILEDASHALGAERDNILVGKNKWSDITVFSFHPVKMITSAEGGMAVTDSEIYAKKNQSFENSRNY